MKKTIIITIIVAFYALAFTNVYSQVITTLNPVADAYVNTFGGGQGGNAYLKFDISSIPAGATINSNTSVKKITLPLPV